MSAEVGTAYVTLAASGKGISKSIKSELGGVQGAATAAGAQSGKKFSGAFGKALKFVGVGAVLAGVFKGVKEGIAYNATLEQTTISLKTMLGSADEASALIERVTEMAAKTPFEFPELADSTKKLIAFGEPAETAVDTMRRLGDVAAGLSIPIGEISEIYGKIRVQGRVFMEDINQLSGRGIPIYKGLADTLGVAESEIREMVSAGEIGFPQIEAAFKNMTDEGGQFAGLMEAQSQSFNGLWSTIKDNLTQVFGKLTTPLFKYMAETIMPKLVEWSDKWNTALGEKGIRGALDDLLPNMEGLKPILQGIGAVMGITRDVFVMAWPYMKQILQTFLSFFAGPTGAALIQGLLDTISTVLLMLGNIFRVVFPAIQQVVQQVVDWFNSPAGTALINQAIDFVIQVAGVLYDVFMAVWPSVMEIVQFAIDFITGPTGTKLIETVLSALETAVTILGDIFNEIWPVISEIVGEVIGFISGPTGTKLIEGAIELINDALEIFQGLWEAAWPAISLALGFAVPIVEGMLEVLTAAIDAVTWALGAAKRAWNEFITLGAYDPKTDERNEQALEKYMALYPELTESQAKAALGLQHGGLITRPTLTMMGEKFRPELVLPLTDMNRTAELLVSSGVAAKLGMGGGVVNNYNVSIDGSKMSTPDFNGFIDSMQRAQRLQGVVS